MTALLSISELCSVQHDSNLSADVYTLVQMHENEIQDRINSVHAQNNLITGLTISASRLLENLKALIQIKISDLGNCHIQTSCAVCMYKVSPYLMSLISKTKQ